MSSSQQLLLGEGAGGGGPVTYIEDVFSTYLYTGSPSAQTIYISLDFPTFGGLLWGKARNSGTYNFGLVDTVRGNNSTLFSSLSNAADISSPAIITSFNSNGFTLKGDSILNAENFNQVMWSFREKSKFFDIVTYTGTGANQTISHNLGSTPGFMLVKSSNNGFAWSIYHQSVGATKAFGFTTAGTDTSGTYWNNTAPTSTTFSVGTNSTVNSSGAVYVAYLFASNAGGFGLTNSDNVITCGSYVGGGASAVNVTVGYEPQWLLIKAVQGGNWYMFDNMRSFPNPSNSNARALRAETNGAEVLESAGFFTATGFRATSGTTINDNDASGYIYVAIRRGPMKIPTESTEVLAIQPRTGTGTETTVTGNQATDFLITKRRNSTASNLFANRLTGMNQMSADLTDAQTTSSASLNTYPWTVQDGVNLGSGSSGSLTNVNNATYINYLFKRAPSFLDVVTYIGTGAVATQAHNLGIVPEMMIVKSRGASGAWYVYHSALGPTKWIWLNDNGGPATTSVIWNDTAPTSSVFTIGTSTAVNTSGGTYVAYLFATLAGVTKVGSYTGTAALQTISCGFTFGAKFVMIKRTDASGDWFVYDSIRGMTSGTDPYFVMNTTAAEVTGTNYVETTSGGFQITAAAPAGLNASGGTYIFYAIRI
jgi:hypothetical protein